MFNVTDFTVCGSIYMKNNVHGAGLVWNDEDIVIAHDCLNLETQCKARHPVVNMIMAM